MKFTKVFHNPTAGEGEHSREKLVAKIKSAGFDCSYSSTKKPIHEKRIPDKTDFITIAGGDGTVRQLATFLFSQTVLEKKYTIGLLPSGTANNIARTLGIKGSIDEIIERWKAETIKQFDVGRVVGLEENHFFLEGLGFGVFPRLMKMMKKRKTKSDEPDQELREALQMLLDIVNTYKPKFCKLSIDDQDYSGEYLLVEVMNIQSIGPNLNIAPNANPGDGQLEVILIKESQRQELAQYVSNRLANGNEVRFFCPSVSAEKVQVQWGGGLLHADDELISVVKSTEIKVEVLKDALNFLV